MTMLYGRIKDKHTGLAVQGEIYLEPELLAYELEDGTLLANKTYTIVLDRDGDFATDVAPQKYWLCLSDARLLIEVPNQAEVSLKELVSVRYKNS
jgi:hypothetical protein